MVRNPSTKAGDAGLVPGSVSLGSSGATHSSILALKILWTEEPGGSQPPGSRRLGHAEQLSSPLSTGQTVLLSFLLSFEAADMIGSLQHPSTSSMAVSTLLPEAKTHSMTAPACPTSLPPMLSLRRPFPVP